MITCRNCHRELTYPKDTGYYRVTNEAPSTFLDINLCALCYTAFTIGQSNPSAGVQRKVIEPPLPAFMVFLSRVNIDEQDINPMRRAAVFVSDTHESKGWAEEAAGTLYKLVILGLATKYGVIPYTKDMPAWTIRACTLVVDEAHWYRMSLITVDDEGAIE